MRPAPTYPRDGSFAYSHIAELKIEMKIGSSTAPNKLCPSLILILASEFVDLLVHRRVDSSLAALSYRDTPPTQPGIRTCAVHSGRETAFRLSKARNLEQHKVSSRRIK